MLTDLEKPAKSFFMIPFYVIKPRTQRTTVNPKVLGWRRAMEGSRRTRKWKREAVLPAKRRSRDKTGNTRGHETVYWKSVKLRLEDKRGRQKKWERTYIHSCVRLCKIFTWNAGKRKENIYWPVTHGCQYTKLTGETVTKEEIQTEFSYKTNNNNRNGKIWFTLASSLHILLVCLLLSMNTFRCALSFQNHQLLLPYWVQNVDMTNGLHR